VVFVLSNDPGVLKDSSYKFSTPTVAPESTSDMASRERKEARKGMSVAAEGTLRRFEMDVSRGSDAPSPKLKPGSREPIVLHMRVVKRLLLGL
jgi:hypothetical protein